MPNNRFNKQVTPKGYKAGGSVKKSEHPLAGRQGNLLHRLKSQKQIKAITDTKKYKDASYNKKQKMLDAGGAYTKSAPDQKSRTSRKMGGRIRRMGRGAQSSKKPIVIKSSPEIILLSAQKEGPAKRHTTIKQIPMNFKKGGEVKRGKDFMSTHIADDARKIGGRGGGADSGKAGEVRSKLGKQEIQMKKDIKKFGKKVKDIVTLKKFHDFAKKRHIKALKEGKTNRGTAEPIGERRVRRMGGGSLRAVQPNQKGLKKLPTEVRNKMGYMKKGGKVHGK